MGQLYSCIGDWIDICKSYKNARPSGVFSQEKIPSDYPCKSHNHDHQLADLVMAWLP